MTLPALNLTARFVRSIMPIPSACSAIDPATLTLIRDVLNREGVEFIDENGGGPGVRLRKPAKDKSRK
jgi:hypothetical protein